MFPSSKYLLERLRAKVGEVQLVGETGNENLSVKRGLALTLRYLEARELGGISKMHSRLRSLDQLLQQLVQADASPAPGVALARNRIAALLREPASDMMTLETAIDGLLLDTEQLLHARQGTPLPVELTRGIGDF